MATVMVRISSFRDFDNKSGINVSRLASNGFFFNEGRIVCFACGAALDNLQRSDDPIKLHRDMSPQCPVVLNSGNEGVQPKSLPFINRSGPVVDRSNSEEDVVDARLVEEPRTNRLSMLEKEPMGEERKSALLGPELSALVQSVYHRHAASQQRENKLRTVSGGGAPGHTGRPALRERQLEESSSFETILEDENREITRNDSRSSEYGLTAALPNRRTTKHRSTPLPYKVKHPDFVDESERLRSFNNVWIFDYRLCTPVQLSKAGFFYEGPEDKVRCFCCGCGLKNFQMEDEPWKEHARYYPRCQFLVEHQDPAFIQAAWPQPVSVPARAVAAPTARSWHNNVASTAAARRGPGPYRVDARDLKARMESPTVKVLLDRGYARELIRQAIESRLSHFGDDFPKITNLLEAVYELENEHTPARFISEPEPPAATHVPAAPAARAAPPQGAQARRRSPSPPPNSQNLTTASALPDLTPRTFGLPASSSAPSGSSTVDGMLPSAVARTPSTSLPSSTASLTSSAASNSSISTTVPSMGNTNNPGSKNGDKLDGTLAAGASRFGSVATAATTVLVGAAAAAVMAAGAPAALAVGAAAAGAAAALAAGSVAVGSAAATGTAGRRAAVTATVMAAGTATERAAGMAAGTAVGTATGMAAGMATGMGAGTATGTASGTVSGTATGMASGTATGMAAETATGIVAGMAAGTATNGAAGRQGVVTAAAGTGAGASSGGVTASTAVAAESKKPKKKNKKKKAAAPVTSAAASTTTAAAAAVQEPKGAEGGQDTVDANDPETQQLLEENGQLREARTCKVCLDKEVDTVFLPCGHLVCCRTCAPELRNCPVCRALIRGTVLIVLT